VRDDDPKNWIGRKRVALGSPTLTDDQREAEYAAYLETSAKVENPWWLDAERTAGVARSLGLAEETPPESVRRSLWDRKFGL
jgi:hypothetical protein